MKRRWIAILSSAAAITALGLITGCDNNGDDEGDDGGSSLLRALSHLQLNVTVDQSTPHETTIAIWPSKQ